MLTIGNIRSLIGTDESKKNKKMILIKTAGNGLKTLGG